MEEHSYTDMATCLAYVRGYMAAKNGEPCGVTMDQLFLAIQESLLRDHDRKTKEQSYKDAEQAILKTLEEIVQGLLKEEPEEKEYAFHCRFCGTGFHSGLKADRHERECPERPSRKEPTLNIEMPDEGKLEEEPEKTSVPTKARAEVEMIPCACGCGTMIPSVDKRGIKRTRAKHHRKGLVYGAKDKGFVPCACGCGTMVKNKFAQGHNRKVKKESKPEPAPAPFSEPVKADTTPVPEVKEVPVKTDGYETCKYCGKQIWGRLMKMHQKKCQPAKKGKAKDEIAAIRPEEPPSLLNGFQTADKLLETPVEEKKPWPMDKPPEQKPVKTAIIPVKKKPTPEISTPRKCLACGIAIDHNTPRPYCDKCHAVANKAYRPRDLHETAANLKAI